MLNAHDWDNARTIQTNPNKTTNIRKSPTQNPLLK